MSNSVVPHPPHENIFSKERFTVFNLFFNLGEILSYTSLYFLFFVLSFSRFTYNLKRRDLRFQAWRHLPNLFRMEFSYNHFPRVPLQRHLVLGRSTALCPLNFKCKISLFIKLFESSYYELNLNGLLQSHCQLEWFHQQRLTVMFEELGM